MKVIVHIILLVVLSLFSRLVYAEDAYQMEILLDESHFEVGDDIDRDDHRLFVSHYFSPVNTAGHPLAEAAFFERIGRIRLDVGPGETTNGLLEADLFSYGILLSFSKPGSPLTGGLSYSKTDTEFQFPVIGGFASEDYGFHVGYFLRDNMHLNFSHRRSETKRSIVGLPDMSFKDQSYAINLKRVKKLASNRAYHLQGGVSLNRFDDPTEEGKNWIVAFSGDYYLNRRISLGGGIALNRGDEAAREGKHYFARTRAFLSPSFSIALFYEEFSAQNSAEDDTTRYSINLSSRF